MSDRELLTILQACVRVGVSRRTVYNWLNAGRLEYLRTAGGGIRIYADSLFQPSTGATMAVERRNQLGA